jgi:hypothetical protein
VVHIITGKRAIAEKTTCCQYDRVGTSPAVGKRSEDTIVPNTLPKLAIMRNLIFGLLSDDHQSLRIVHRIKPDQTTTITDVAIVNVKLVSSACTLSDLHVYRKRRDKTSAF